MKLFISIILSLFLYGCSALKSEQTDLYEFYVKQSQSIKNNNHVSDREEFFTRKYLEKVDLNDKKSLLLLSLSKYLDKELSHYQKIDGKISCLSINGIEKSGEPISIHIEYKQEKGLWLVDYMFLHFIESSEDYTKQALCPREVENMIIQ